VVKAFAANDDVVFGDVMLSDPGAIRGEPHNPGAGGWPTIRYFNKETGLEGGTYVKKTSKAMCDELGNDEMMTAYVEEYGNTSLCSVSDGAGCSEKEVAYISKMKLKSKDDQAAQLQRLINMDSSSMKPHLLQWNKQRQKILKKLVEQGHDEL